MNTRLTMPTLALLLLAALLVTRAPAAFALGCVAQSDGSVRCELPVVEDSIVAGAHRDNNHGHEAHMWVKVGNGINRALERIDLRAIAGRTDVTSATLRHYIYKVGDGATATFDVLAADPNAPPFVEGKDKFQSWGYCSDSDWRQPSMQTGEPGVTYNCPVDPLPNDGSSADCPAQWVAGFPGFLTPPIDTTIRPAPPPPCRASLDCFHNGGDPTTCWDTFEFDITSLIQSEAAMERPTTDVMIKRSPPETGAGGVWWFSVQGAMCVLGATDPPLQALRPVLIVELASGPVPTVPTPLVDPCL
jgi:hypothetical protein